MRSVPSGGWVPPSLKPPATRYSTAWEERTHHGDTTGLLDNIDEFTHECLMIRESRRLKSIDVVDLCRTCGRCCSRCRSGQPTQWLVLIEDHVDDEYTDTEGDVVHAMASLRDASEKGPRLRSGMNARACRVC